MAAESNEITNIIIKVGRDNVNDGVHLALDGELYDRIHLTPQGLIKTGDGLSPPISNGLSGLSAEDVRNTIAAMATAGANVSIVHDDPGNTLTFAVTGLGTDDVANLQEFIEDTVRDEMLQGTGITLVYNDTTGELTVSVNSGSPVASAVGDTMSAGSGNEFALANHRHSRETTAEFNELVDERVKDLIVEGTGIDKVYDDGAGTLTLSASASGGAPLFASKTADTSRISDTTLTNDPHLVLALEANSTYLFSSLLMTDTVSATPHAKIDWTVPAGATLLAEVTTKNTSLVDVKQMIAASEVLVIGLANTGVDTISYFKGIVRTGGTAGNITLRTAQNVSNGAASVFRTNSYLTIQKAT